MALSPPTIDDARRAAEALWREGVGRVLVFGSVARGRAGPHSDIDLVAIDADLDYSIRLKRQLDLERIVRRVCEFPIQLFLTDEPEWRIRSTQVRSSFEAHIAAYAIELETHRYVSDAVDWSKPIGRPDSDEAELADRLEAVSDEIVTLQHCQSVTDNERRLARDDAVLAEHRRRVRHTSMLARAYRTILAAARVMHVATLGAAPPKGDTLSDLLAPQPSWVAEAFEHAVDNRATLLVEMHFWRNHGQDEPGQRTRRVDPDWAATAYDAAHDIVAWALERLDLDAEVIESHRRLLTCR
ncbi:nucleotidyltransferase domain-containing protein [Candidatus Poriferisodalis sp.]|uniref:nucleotidyltransferase domain-containing protein n=1 Tax=Candidatus Poriferisodalis sp. TaxID=3101277 RepID=UPI003B02D649